MVCHETYKDEKNNWLSPEEVFIMMERIFYKKETVKKLLLVLQSLCQNPKKIQLIHKILLINMGQMLLDFLF